MDSREQLLYAWMDMNVRIRGNRLLDALSFNEIMVLSLLRRHEAEDALTAAELGERMRLLRSEMNKLLSGMERKQLILRSPSAQDRRKIELCIHPNALPLYEQEHERAMRYVDRIAERIGMEQVTQLARLLLQATAAVE